MGSNWIPKNIIKYLKQGTFLGNVGTMMGGNIFAQAITFFTAPVITRIYNPNDFGAFAFVWAYVSVLSIIASMRYEYAIVIEKNQNTAVNVLTLCIAIAGIVSSILFLIIILAGQPLAALLNSKNYTNLFYLLPLAVFVSSAYNSLTFWYTRLKKFTTLAICRLTSTSVIAIIKISLGFFWGSSALFLLWGNIFGISIIVVILIIIFLKNNLSLLVANVSRSNLIHCGKKYKNLPKYHAWNGLLNSVSQNLPIFLLAHFFSPQILGFYGLSNMVLRRPMNLVSESFSKVFLEKASKEINNRKKLREIHVKTTIGLVGIAIVPYFIIGIFGEYIFSIVFGEKWGMAGFYAQLLAPWLFMGFINPPSTQILIAKQNLKFIFYFNLILTLFRIIALLVTSSLYPHPWLAIFAFSATGVLFNIYYIVFAFSQTRCVDDY